MMKTVHSNIVQGSRPDTGTILQVHIQGKKMDTLPQPKNPGEDGWSSGKNIRELHGCHIKTSARSLIGRTEPDYGFHPDNTEAGRREELTQLNTLTPQGQSTLVGDENMKNPILFSLMGLHGIILKDHM